MAFGRCIGSEPVNIVSPCAPDARFDRAEIEQIIPTAARGEILLIAWELPYVTFEQPPVDSPLIVVSKSGDSYFVLTQRSPRGWSAKSRVRFAPLSSSLAGNLRAALLDGMAEAKPGTDDSHYGWQFEGLPETCVIVDQPQLARHASHWMIEMAQGLVKVAEGGTRQGRLKAETAVRAALPERYRGTH